MKKSIAITRFQFYLSLGVLWLALFLFTLINSPDTFVVQSLNEAWKLIYLIFAHFIFFEYSVPFIIKKRSTMLFNFVLGILLVSTHIVLVSFGLYAWNFLGMTLHIYTQLRFSTILPYDPYSQLLDAVTYEARGGLISTFVFGIAKLFYQNFKLGQAAQLLRLEKKEAELNYLKSQTNPHFLFNTLNNIYSLARDKNDLAPESILRLSQILRFMLYETGEKFVSIGQELEIIINYIALEKLRYDDSLSVNFKHEIEDMNQALPPLLLIPLVENAFKHGPSETNGQAFVSMHLSIHQQKLAFVVKNSTENIGEKRDVKENIGLSNLRRQLELLYTDYNLSVQQHEAVFTATLKINTASHV